MRRTGASRRSPLGLERLDSRRLLAVGAGAADPVGWPLLQANLDADLDRGWVFANALAAAEAIVSGEWGGALTAAEAGQVAESLDVDAAGWPRSLPTFAGRRSVLWSAPRYHVADVADPDSPGATREALLHGVWVLTWDGTGEVRLETSRQDAGPDGSPAAGYQMLARESNRLVLLIRDRFLGPVVTIRATDPADHVRNLRLWAPRFDGAGLDLAPGPSLSRGAIAASLEPAPGQPEPLFHPVYLAHLRELPATVVRPMGWYRINDNHDATPVAWSDRAGAGYALASLNAADASWDRHPVADFRQRVGMPYETLVALANQTGKDLWLNIPHTASPDFIRGLAGYLAGAAGLDPGRRVWVEFSNEIWNASGAYLPQVNQARAAAAAHFSLPLDQVPEMGPGHAWGSGTLQARAVAEFEAAWLAAGGADERLVNVIAGFVALSSFNEQVLAAAAAVDPRLAEAFAVTSYFGDGTQEEIWNLHWAFHADAGGGLDPTRGFSAGVQRWRQEDLFRRTAAIVRRNLHATAAAWADNVALADAATLPLVGYEGGQHMLVGGRGDRANPLHADFLAFYEAFNDSPEMGRLTTEQFALWAAAGAETASVFTDVGGSSFFGSWGAKTSVLESRADAPKWDAILGWAETQAGVRSRSSPLGSRPSLAGAAIRGEAGLPLESTISAGGGEGPVSLALVAGELPPGVTCTISPGGSATLSGTPTAAGLFRLVVRALDSDGDAAYRVYAVQVDPAGTARGGLVLFDGGAIPASVRPDIPDHENGRYDPTRPWVEERTADGRKRQVIPFDAGPTGRFFAGEYAGGGHVIGADSPLNVSGGMAVTSGPGGDAPYVGLREGAFRGYTGDSSAPHSFDLFAVWRREQFAGVVPGARFRFGTSPTEATLRIDFTSLAETASILRFAVLAREHGQDVWYLSEAAYDSTLVGDGFFALSGFVDSAAAGKRWATITPGPTSFGMPPAAGLSFAARTFEDVQAVGLVYHGEKWRYHDEFAFTRFLAIGGVVPADDVLTVAAGSQADAAGRTGATRIVKRGAGTLVLSGASTHTGGVVVEEGEVIVNHIATLGTGGLDIRAGAKVTLDVGSVNWNGGTNFVSLAGLVLDPAGRLDVGIGQIRVVPGGYDAATIRTLLVAGRNNGSWNGPAGITSASAGPGTSRAVGYRVVPGSSELRLGFAAVGDANLDGQVNQTDINLLLAAGRFNQATAAVWAEGDFNYSGGVTQTDINLLSGRFGQGNYLPPQPVVSSAEFIRASAFATLTGDQSDLTGRRRKAR